MRILLTRPEADARRTAARLEALGHEVVVVPLFEIVQTGAPTPEGRFDRLLATSAHAFENLPVAAERLKGLPLDAVGERTAAAAKQAGFAHTGLVTPDAKALGIAIARAHGVPQSFVYLAGRERRPELEASLAALGHTVAPWIIYETREVEGARESLARIWASGGVDAVLHFSPRAAALYVAHATSPGLREKALEPVQIAISPRAAESLEGAPVLRVAPTPDLEGLLSRL